MANIKYRIGRSELLHGLAGDFESAGKFKCVLVGEGSTFLADHPATNAAFTNLVPVTGSADVTLAGVAIVEDTTRDREYVTATDPTFTGLTPDDVIVGMVIYRWVTNFNASVPYFGIGLGQPTTVPESGEYIFPFNADGVVAL